MVTTVGYFYCWCPNLQRPPQGYSITVYHSMHAEVDQYRTHHWQVCTIACVQPLFVASSVLLSVACLQLTSMLLVCSWPCRFMWLLLQCPKCGNVVKRAMNRPPQEADCRGRQGKGPDCKDTKCAYHMHQRFCGSDYTKVQCQGLLQCLTRHCPIKHPVILPHRCNHF